MGASNQGVKTVLILASGLTRQDDFMTKQN